MMWLDAEQCYNLKRMRRREYRYVGIEKRKERESRK